MNEERRAFVDICRGYSLAKHKSQNIYVKHLSNFEQVEIDEYYDRCLESVKKQKIPSKAEKLKWLEDKKLWTPQQEKDLVAKKFYLDGLNKTKDKLFLKSDVDRHKETIKKATADYNKLFVEKDSLLGLTQEKIAETRMYNYYIFISFFKDPELKKPIFRREDFDDLDDFELDEYFAIYLKSIEHLGEKGLKKVAISPFFTSLFYISEDTTSFYERPMSRWTFYQTNLIHLGQYFKSIVQNHPNLPEDVRNDPDKLEEYVKMATRLKEVVDKNPGKEGGFRGIVASPEDLRHMGLTVDNSIRNQVEKGGEISSINEAITKIKTV